ncbi:unnamed protein product [Phaedon cochleariae]|uniref:MADF domain-containing protein n=1 Tax=Phaedon cochleariae TaxID=80249 RepID=A0A9N9SGF5_PHACE|nr:unnamed protein product [Phaedon cochleariae]
MEKIVNDGQLIELVRQFSVLYDPKSREYKNSEVKSNAWKTIGEVMNASVAECEARWISLRTIYSRESKKSQNHSYRISSYQAMEVVGRNVIFECLYKEETNQRKCANDRATRTKSKYIRNKF